MPVAAQQSFLDEQPVGEQREQEHQLDQQHDAVRAGRELDEAGQRQPDSGRDGEHRRREHRAVREARRRRDPEEEATDDRQRFGETESHALEVDCFPVTGSAYASGPRPAYRRAKVR